LGTVLMIGKDSIDEREDDNGYFENGPTSFRAS
jgi:hypothetical protein